MNNIGVKIKDLRKKKKLSLQALGDMAGITKSYLWELETGKHKNPSLKTMLGIADSLGVTCDYFAYDDLIDSDNDNILIRKIVFIKIMSLDLEKIKIISRIVDAL